MLISKTVCHQGLVREQNEDSYISNADESLWLVADGVGGNVGGDIASQLAVQTVDRHVRQGAKLKDSIVYANDALLSVSAKQPELSGMATTIVAARFNGCEYEIAWVGDSRAYLVESDAIKQLSADHNVANELLVTGEITHEESINHAGQHELTQALGQLSLNEVPSIEGHLSSGSILLICSDGLSGVLTEREILNKFKEFETLEQVSDSLLSDVLQAGAPDNVTFTLIASRAEDDLDKRKPASDDVKARDNVQKVSRVPLIFGGLFIVSLIMIILFFWID